MTLRLTPQTSISELVDINKLKSGSTSESVKDPYYREIRMGFSQQSEDQPLTLLDYFSYLQKIKVFICCGAHEHPETYNVTECPIRDENIACFHGLELDRDSFSRRLLSSNVWGIRLFVLAYFLKEAGYNVPLFIEDFEQQKDKLTKLDDEARALQSEASEGKNVAEISSILVKKQKSIGQLFEQKYLEPIREAYLDFYFKNVVEASA